MGQVKKTITGISMHQYAQDTLSPDFESHPHDHFKVKSFPF